jgi:hypothetical protein
MENIAKLKINEILKATADWKKIISLQSRFLMTPSDNVDENVVPLFWLPALHTEKTRAMLQKQQVKVVTPNKLIICNVSQ